MKKQILIFVFAFIMAFLTGCGKHQHAWLEANCTNSATCSECNETEGNALGHTTTVGVCRRCEEVQDEVMLEKLNFAFAKTMDEGGTVINLLSNVATLSKNEQYERFVEADSHIRVISDELSEVISSCSSVAELSRLVYQSQLLLNRCPEPISGKDDVSLANQTMLYQLFLQQISSSFSFLSEDMDYLAGNRDFPDGIRYFDELEKMPTPDSVIYGITYDSEKSDAGVKQYMYLIGSNESDANMNYNNYLSAIDLEPTLEYELAESYAIVTKDGNMVSAMMAGTDPQKGYFLIISFQE